MPPTNDFLPFATAGGANVLTQAAYASSPQLGPGQQSGIASSALNNKALRQATYMVSCLAQFLANTTGDDVLDDATQAEILATMALAWPNSVLPTQQILTVTGSTVGYLFTCSTANATVAAVYANNGHNYTVLATLASGTLLFCSGASAPLSSGTLTKQSGTGDSTISFSLAQALATYTAPTNVKYLKIKGIGAGGGAAGNAGVGSAGNPGSITAFGPSIFYGTGGGAGGNGGTTDGGVGGSGIVNTGTGISGIGLNGSTAMPGYANNEPGGNGAPSPFGGGGNGTTGNTGGNAPNNTGAGGGGGGGNGDPGGGGGAGGYFEGLISGAPLVATFVYCIGVGGIGGGTGPSGNGGSGLIIVEEHYAG